jgi:hypothetical protein
MKTQHPTKHIPANPIVARQLADQKTLSVVLFINGVIRLLLALITPLLSLGLMVESAQTVFGPSCLILLAIALVWGILGICYFIEFDTASSRPASRHFIGTILTFAVIEAVVVIPLAALTLYSGTKDNPHGSALGNILLCAVPLFLLLLWQGYTAIDLWQRA